MNLSSENSRVSGLAAVAIPFVLASLVIAWMSYSFTTNALNESQIIYRYAEEFRAGNGLVFNTGERVLLIPSPLYIFLLGTIATLFSTVDISTLAGLVFGLSLGIGAIAMYWIARHVGLSALLSTVATLLYILAWPFLLGTDGANPIASMLCLLAIVFALNERWRFAGIALACGILCSPQAILLGMPLLLFAANKGKATRFISALTLPLVIALLVLWLYYRTSLWNGLLILKNNDADSFLASWIPVLLLLPIALAVWGWFKERANPIVALLGAWVALDLAVSLLLYGQVSAGAALSAIPILIFIGLKAIHFQSRPLTWLSVSLIEVIVVVAIIFGTVIATPGYPEFLSPMGNLSQARTIALNSAAQLFELEATPNQSIVAFDGQLQPDLKEMLERGDAQSALIRYAPDVLIVRGDGKVRAKDITSPAVARLGYRPRQELDTYIRNAAVGTFADVPIAANFGPDIRLVGTALDQTTLKPGQVLRVRLDWQYTRPASQNIIIDLRLVSGSGDEFLLAHSTDTYDPSVFRAGPYSTYHTLAVIDRAWPGPVTLEVAVVINGGVAARLPIAKLAITAR